jgi:hypothetical protein
MQLDMACPGSISGFVAQVAKELPGQIDVLVRRARVLCPNGAVQPSS